MCFIKKEYFFSLEKSWRENLGLKQTHPSGTFNWFPKFVCFSSSALAIKIFLKGLSSNTKIAIMHKQENKS